MTQHKELLIKNSIRKADEALFEAGETMDMSLSLAQNRNYYAVFYIVLALAYLDGFQTGKHYQLMGWFNKEYIHKNKIFDTELNEIYKNLIFNREKADYSVLTILERSNVEKGLKEAKFFVATVKEYILKRMKDCNC